MEFIAWVKKHGLTALLIGAVIGIYTFFIEGRHILQEHEETMKELKDDMKNMPKRILDEVRAREFLRKMQEEGVNRDTIEGVIKIN